MNVTDEDREKASEVLDACGVRPELVPIFVAGIADALAGERERARTKAMDQLKELASHCAEYGLRKQSAAATFASSYLECQDAVANWAAAEESQ